MASLKNVDYLNISVRRLVKAEIAVAVVELAKSQPDNFRDLFKELDTAELQYQRAIKRLREEVR